MSDTHLKPVKPTKNHVEAAGRISIDKIKIGDRLRIESEFHKRYVAEELAPSIAEHGLIQPIVLDDDDNLIAGFSRVQAFRLLGHKTIPFVFRKDLPEHDRLALELEENIRRLDMPWIDQALAIKKIHLSKVAAKAADAERWGIRQTGKLLGVSAGHVSEAILTANLILNGDKAVLNCKSLREVRKILATRKEDELHKALAKSSGLTPKKVDKESGPAAGEKPKPKIDLMSRSTVEHEKPGTPERYEIELSKMLFHADCLKWMKQREPESVDLVYTDIPYGIDMANLEELATAGRVIDSHDVDENVSQMLPFLQGAYRVLKDKSYLLFWYDLKHHEKLVEWGNQVGFAVQNYPNIWIKTHPCKNQAAHCHWTKAVEYVMVMRKGTATLRTPQNVNYYAANGAPERKLQANPFAKPFEFSKWLLDPVMMPGMTVLDCYAGEGSLVRAVLNLGGRVLAVEKDELHYNRLVEHVKTYYKNALKGDIIFS